MIVLGLFISVLATLQFAVSVQISDGCAAPTDALHQAVDLFADIEVVDIFKYYLDCTQNETLSNPLSTSFDTSYHIIIGLNDTMLLLRDNAPIYGIVQEVDHLYYDY